MKKTIISFFIPKEGEKAENESKWIRFLIPFGLVTLATLGIFGYWGVTTHPNRWLYGVYALPIIGALYSMWNKQNLKSALGDIGAIGIFLVSYYAFFATSLAVPFFVKVLMGAMSAFWVLPYFRSFESLWLKSSNLFQKFVLDTDSFDKLRMRIKQFIFFFVALNLGVGYGCCGSQIGAFIAISLSCLIFSIISLIWLASLEEGGYYIGKFPAAMINFYICQLLIWGIAYEVKFSYEELLLVRCGIFPNEHFTMMQMIGAENFLLFLGSATISLGVWGFLYYRFMR